MIDWLFLYGKTHAFTVNPRRPLTSEEEVTMFPNVDGDTDQLGLFAAEHGCAPAGRRYNQRLALFSWPCTRDTPTLVYEWNGFTCPHPSGWQMTKEKMDEEFAKGNIVITERPAHAKDQPNRSTIIKDGKTYTIQRRSYLDDYRGFPLGNLWTDDAMQLTDPKERIGYPTQKPLALLTRIIQTSSKEQDIVLDPFCGSGTTCIAAEHLGRQWIGIDRDAKAVAVSRSRLNTHCGVIV